ncbi:hypothetical protein [Fibrobacter sp.]|uniref:hypothetical protein n=1 Tax=Fibrobacter sp. TaxID=35828 RepID=UPI001564B0E2
MKKTLPLILSIISFAFAKFDAGKAVNEGVSTGLDMVGGFLILSIIIAFAFAIISKGRKK